VTEVALAVGFADPVSFTAAFHRLVGTTPTKYRRALR
jgi:AraC-like DNA-binding protein